MNRRGMGLLWMVLVLGCAAATVALAYHTLGRGSARTMFSLQERRELEALGRSALQEAFFTVESSLEQGSPHWMTWLATTDGASSRTVPPSKTRELAVDIPQDPTQIAYQISDVTVTRMKPVKPPLRGKLRSVGLVDLEVTTSVRRQLPRHEAALRLVERRWIRVAEDLGPFAAAGKHLELSPEPMASWMEAP